MLRPLYNLCLFVEFFLQRSQGPRSSSCRNQVHLCLCTQWLGRPKAGWSRMASTWVAYFYSISTPYISHPVGYLLFSHMAAELSSMKEQKCTSLREPRLGTGTHHSLGQSKLKGPTGVRGMGNRYHFLIRGHAKHTEIRWDSGRGGLWSLVNLPQLLSPFYITKSSFRTVK